MDLQLSLLRGQTSVEQGQTLMSQHRNDVSGMAHRYDVEHSCMQLQRRRIVLLDQ